MKNEIHGYGKQSLLTGETFFNAITTFKHDLILMDVMLGNMDGIEIVTVLNRKL